MLLSVCRVMRNLAIRKRSRYLAAVAAVGLAVALTGCAETDDPQAPAGQSDNQANEPGDNMNVSLVVDQPQPDETVSLPFEVAVTTDVPLGTIDSGAPHMHVWFDDAVDQVMIIESASQMIESAPDGATMLRVQVHTYDHQPASELVEVPITVEGGNGEGGSRPAPPNDY